MPLHCQNSLLRLLAWAGLGNAPTTPTSVGQHTNEEEQGSGEVTDVSDADLEDGETLASLSEADCEESEAAAGFSEVGDGVYWVRHTGCMDCTTCNGNNTVGVQLLVSSPARFQPPFLCQGLSAVLKWQPEVGWGRDYRIAWNGNVNDNGVGMWLSPILPCR